MLWIIWNGIEEAFAKGGVAISFREPFEEDRVQEVKKK